jgi:light-regulated signal transduction histidine kinase (bacteriophytochrome)
LRVVAIDTVQMVNAVIEEFREEIADREIHWTVGRLPRLQGDPTLMRLVFQNLLGNAIKFTRDQAKAEIEILPLDGLTGECGLMVRDNGVGFDPTYGHKLFKVFQRLHREDEFEGTGIGLANVHRIVSRHGGRGWAEGRPGQGATFFIAFPEPGRES